MYISKYNLIFEIEGHNDKILFNPLSGAMDIISDYEINILKKIKDGKLDKCDEKLIEPFLERKYVFTNKNEESELLLQTYEIYKKMKFKKRLTYLLIPTYSCNLRCPYCFEEENIKLQSKIMEGRVLSRAFETIEYFREERKEAPPPHIVLFGGEPFLKRKNQIEIIKQILKISEEHGYTSSAVSNGVDLIYYCNIIKRYNNFEDVQITLDGTKEVHNKRRMFSNGKGSFDNIVEGVDMALNYGINIVLRTNVDSQNIEELPQLAKFIYSKGWNDYDNFRSYVSVVKDFSNKSNWCHIAPPTSLLKRLVELKKIHEEMKVIGLEGYTPLKYITRVLKEGKTYFPVFSFCGANDALFCFDPFGDLYACTDSVGRREHSVGKFYPTLTIDHTQLQKWRELDIFKNSRCRECDVSLICGGGCAYSALCKYGSTEYPFCEPIKEILQLGFSYYFSQLKEIPENRKELLREGLSND